MTIITDERCMGYSLPGHPERPERIAHTLQLLREQVDLPISWQQPLPVDEAALLRAHSAKMIARLNEPEDLDPDTPYYPGIAEHARRSVGAGLAALKCARAGQTAFSLMRPPGHHATRRHAMGFCYLNNIAIAALEALATGTKKIAVYDFDVHHGNGTEDILRDQPGAAFFSIHQFPYYPGTGAEHVGNAFNYPVAPATPRDQYRRNFARAFEEVRKFGPDLLAVSAGFDAYARDPLAHGTLEAEDYHWLGESIRKLGIPSFSLLEGGYSDDMPELILAYLKGLE